MLYRWASNKRNRSYYGWAAYFLPCLRWLYGYNLRENLLVCTADTLSFCAAASAVVAAGQEPPLASFGTSLSLDFCTSAAILLHDDGNSGSV